MIKTSKIEREREKELSSTIFVGLIQTNSYTNNNILETHKKINLCSPRKRYDADQDEGFSLMCLECLERTTEKPLIIGLTFSTAFKIPKNMSL